MIHEALIHLPGIGPERLRRLHDCGFRNWQDILDRPDALPVPVTQREALVAEVRRCAAAYAARDIRTLLAALDTGDHWRLLAEFFEDLSFFDIETTGLENDAEVTVIACWHRHTLHRFVAGENLEAFLELLDDVRLLVSYNGASFDVPRVLQFFHIPALPCPHLDLRWLLKRHELSGGLKAIEPQLGVQRPADLRGVDGAEAVRYWLLWKQFGNRRARNLLERYCCADVIALECVTARLLQSLNCGAALPFPAEIWKELDRQLGPPPEPERLPDTPRPLTLPGSGVVLGTAGGPAAPGEGGAGVAGVALPNAEQPTAREYARPPATARFPCQANTPAAAARLLQARLRNLRQAPTVTPPSASEEKP